MTVIKKFVSILLAASLCIGSIFSVQGDNAFSADAAAQPDINASVIQALLSQYSSDMNYVACYDLLHNSWSSNYMICFTYYDDRNWNVTVWRSSSDSSHPATQWQINTVNDGFSFHPRGYGYLQCKYFYCVNGTFTSNYAVAWRMLDRVYVPGSVPILSSPCAPADSTINLTTYKVYFSQNLYYGDNVNQASSTLAYYYNLNDQFGPPPAPATQYTTLIYFTLGDTEYVTVEDQDMFNTLKFSDTAQLGFGYYHDGDESGTYLTLLYDDLTVIPGGESQVPGGVSNLKPQGLMAIDVSGYDWDTILSCALFDMWYDEPFQDWGVTNVPFEKPTDPEESQSASEVAWEQFLVYYNTYNHTQIVPGDLADQVFGITGSQCAPAWVALPDDICNSGATYYPLEIRWGFNDLNQSLVKWDLMDVCCISAGGDDYLVEYRQNALASPQQVEVAHMSLDEIFERFDVVIIVDGRTSEVGNLRIFNGWYGSPTGTSILDQYFGWTGANGSGIIRENLAVSPYDDDVTYHGFSFWTERGIAKQRLYNFNDGLENTYKLMSDYVFSTEDWRASFLAWSSSVFYKLDSIGGFLDKTKRGSIGWFLDSDIKLSDYLDNILDKLDNLVNNTSVDEVDPGSWFPSLWRFINRFSIQDSTFANWLDDLDDFYDDLPDLPEIQPTVIPFPTYIPEPTAGVG